jgi:3-keto-5-aminohexanoate cleavage enzyme
MATMAIAMGGHVRVGFEDNIFYRKGELADSNARFVERVVRIAREVGREPATIDEARSILRIPPPAVA